MKVPWVVELYQEFTCVEERIKKHTKTFEAHPTRRLKLRTDLERKKKECGFKEDTCCRSRWTA